MKIILSLIAVAVVMGFTAPKVEARDHCRESRYESRGSYCPPSRPVYRQPDPCYRPSYDPCYRPQYRQQYRPQYNNCEPRRYRSSGFSITIVR